MDEQGSSRGPYRILAYMTTWCPDCVEAHKLLKRSGLPFTLIDVESVPGAEIEMLKAANGVRKVPTILIDGPKHREVLVEPAPELLMEALCRLREIPKAL